MTEQQYESFCVGYYPDWDCRYAPVKIGEYHYIVRSGYWLKKFKYQRSADGLYHIVESYTSVMECGRNLLIECLTHGYFRTEVLSHEELKEYYETYGPNSVIIVNGKPEHCIHCHLPELKEVIYGEPSERVDKDRFILGGCCISEYSHNWECPQCKAMYRDESWW